MIFLLPGNGMIALQHGQTLKWFDHLVSLFIIRWDAVGGDA